MHMLRLKEGKLGVRWDTIPDIRQVFQSTLGCETGVLLQSEVHLKAGLQDGEGYQVCTRVFPPHLQHRLFSMYVLASWCNAAANPRCLRFLADQSLPPL